MNLGSCYKYIIHIIHLRWVHARSIQQYFVCLHYSVLWQLKEKHCFTYAVVAVCIFFCQRHPATISSLSLVSNTYLTLRDSFKMNLIERKKLILRAGRAFRPAFDSFNSFCLTRCIEITCNKQAYATLCGLIAKKLLL